MDLYCYEESDELVQKALQDVTNLLWPIHKILSEVAPWTPAHIRQALQAHHFRVAAAWFLCLDIISGMKGGYGSTTECYEKQIHVGKLILMWNQDLFSFFFSLKK